MTPFALIVALAAVSSASAQITIRYAPAAAPQSAFVPATQTYSQPWREPATPGSIQVLRPNPQQFAPPVTAPVVGVQPQYAPVSAPVVGPSYATPVNYAPAPNIAYSPVQPVPYVPATRTYYPAGQIQQTNYYAPNAGYPVRRVANYADPCGCQPGPVGYAPATTAYNQAPYQAVATTNGAPHYAWQPVVALRGTPDNYFVGQGIIGQPKVYVEGEPVRNFFRYILP